MVGGTGRAFGTPKLQVCPLIEDLVIFQANRLGLIKLQPWFTIILILALLGPL